MDLSKLYSKNIFVRISFYIIMLLSIFISSPYLYRNYNKIIILILMILICVGILVRISTGIKLKYVKLNILVLWWCFWIIFLKIIGFSTASLGNYIGQIIFFGMFTIMSFVDTYFDRVRKDKLFKFITTIIVVNLIHNIILNTQNEYLSTIIFTSEGAELLNTNLGATTFSAMILIFCGIMFALFFQQKNNFNKFVLVIIVLLCGDLIINKQSRATGTILLVVMMLFIFFEQKLNLNEGYRRVLFYLFLLIVMSVVLIPVLEFISSHISNDRINERLMSLITFLKNEGTVSISGQDSFATRLFLIKSSLTTFVSSFKNIILGEGYNIATYSTMNDMISHTGIGYHSELIDILGVYGLIGGITIFMILKEYFKVLKYKFKKSNIDNEINVVYFTFIVFSFSNVSFTAELGLTAVLLLSLTKIENKCDIKGE